MRKAIKAWGQDVDYGRGFVLVRGLRTHLYSDALSAAIYYILGLHMGDPIRQNEMGDSSTMLYATSDKTMADPTALSSKVRDQLVLSFRQLRHRGAHVSAACTLWWPVDACRLGCGIYNEILRRRPDLAPLLLEPFHWDWRRQTTTHRPTPTHRQWSAWSMACSACMRARSTFSLRRHIRRAEAQPGPDRSAGKLFDEITYEPGMAIEMDFRPGDIRWLSNYAAFHARAAFSITPSRNGGGICCGCGFIVIPGGPSSRASARTAWYSTDDRPRNAGAEHAEARFRIMQAAPSPDCSVDRKDRLCQRKRPPRTQSDRAACENRLLALT